MDNKRKVIFQLPNGIRALIIPLETKLTHIAVNIKLGTNHEKKDEMEITHYMEHMMGRFTSKKYKDMMAVNTELDNRGAKTSAYVNDTVTCFWIIGLYKDIEFYIDLLANTISDFRIENSIIQQEKNAVNQELRNYMMDEQYIFDCKIWKYMYPNYKYLIDLEKHIEHIKNYNIGSLYHFIKTHIIPTNIVVTISCPINAINKTKNLVKKYFNFKIKKTTNRIIYPNLVYDNHCLKMVFIKNHIKTNNSIIRVYVNKEINRFSKQHLYLTVLKNCLFKFGTGIFHNTFRDKLGLIYHINMYINIDTHNEKQSYYYIETEVVNNKIPDFMKFFINIVENLTINKADFDSAIKSILINKNMKKFHNLSSYNDYYNSFLLNNKPIIEKSEVIKYYKTIKYEDILQYLETFKQDILNATIFYFAQNNKNKEIKNTVNKKFKYVSL